MGDALSRLEVCDGDQAKALREVIQHLAAQTASQPRDRPAKPVPPAPHVSASLCPLSCAGYRVGQRPRLCDATECVSAADRFRWGQT